MSCGGNMLFRCRNVIVLNDHVTSCQHLFRSLQFDDTCVKSNQTWTLECSRTQALAV